MKMLNLKSLIRPIRLPFNIPGYNGLAGTWPLPPLVSKSAAPRVEGNEMVHWWAFTEIAIALSPFFLCLSYWLNDYRSMILNIFAPHTVYLVLFLYQRTKRDKWFLAYFHHPMEIASRKYELELDQRPYFAWLLIILGKESW